MIRFSKLVSAILTTSLALGQLYSQSAAPGLRLRVVPFEVGAGSGASKGLTAEVTGNDGAPVAGAAVTFRFPEDGTSGSFADGKHSSIMYTDASGRATIQGIHWTPSSGSSALRVTVSKGDQHAGTLVDREVLAATSSPQGLAKPEPSVAQANPPKPAQSQSSQPFKPVRPGVSIESLSSSHAAKASSQPAIASPSKEAKSPTSSSRAQTGEVGTSAKSGSSRLSSPQARRVELWRS